MINKLIERIKKNTPTGLVTRAQIEELTDGLLKRKRLTDLDSLGKGIPGKMYAGKTVIYNVDEVCQFLENVYIKK